MEFKDRVYQARKAKGLSQEKLAELVGVSRQAVSKWETGEAMPDLEKLIALCRVLELDMEYLALGKEPAPPAPAPAKPRRWRPILLTLTAAICMAAGILIGSLLPTEDTAEAETGIVNAESLLILESVRIADVTVKSISGENAFTVSVLPSLLVEGMEVSLVYEETNSQRTPYVVSCKLAMDGSHYQATLRHSGSFHYTIAAILTLDSHQKQIPILDIQSHEYGLSYAHIWEEQQ